jgi:hypothetical protein
MSAVAILKARFWLLKKELRNAGSCDTMKASEKYTKVPATPAALNVISRICR